MKLNQIEHFSAKWLQSIYQNRFKANLHQRNLVWKILCNNFFCRYINKSAMLLDLGAGYGEFIRHIQAETNM